MQHVVAVVVAVLVVVVGSLGPVLAEPRPPARALKIAVLPGVSGPADHAVAASAFAGIEAAKKRGPLTVAVRVASRPEIADAMIDQLAHAAPDLIIGVGALHAEPFRAASARHPHTRFLLLDAELPGLPNVKSVTFRADEGSFLAGVVAALETKRGRVGFVGGMATPAIQAFECGWETGVRWTTKDRYLTVRGRAVYIGTTPDAFANPTAGAALTHAMITEQGADVVYAAAGASGHGVIAAARQAKVKVIGVDADQRHLAPDAVITSVRKRLDRAVETTIAEVRRDAFQGGVTEMGLANGGVDLVLPGRLAPATVKVIEKARAAIVSGTTPACVKEEDRVPAWPFPPRPMG